jgi:hypothetical protein
LYGYGTLLLVLLAIGCAWWYDRALTAQQVANLGGELKQAAQRAAILDDEVGFLVGELQKSGGQIERMAGGGFRRTVGIVPPEYRIGQASTTRSGADYSIGNAPVLPGGYKPMYVPR